MTNPRDMSHSHYSNPRAAGGGSDAEVASATPQRKGTKSRKRQRTPPQLLTAAAPTAAEGHHLALMPSAFIATSNSPNEHPFSLPDPSLLSPTAAYPPLTDPLSSSLPTLLTDSLRLTSPAASADDDKVSASLEASPCEGPTGGSSHSSLLYPATIRAHHQSSQPEEMPAGERLHSGQQQLQQQMQPLPNESSHSARPRFVARRHSDVMPFSTSSRLNTTWTSGGRESTVLEAPSPVVDSTSTSPSKSMDSHAIQTALQLSPTGPDLASLAQPLAKNPPDSSASPFGQQSHPHTSPSSYSPHPHVLPTIPAIGSSSFHPHSIAPPPPPPHYPLPSAMPSCHDSPNPTAKKKMRSEPPPSSLPVSSAGSGIPTTLGLGLFDPLSLTVGGTNAGGSHMFGGMLDMSQPSSSGSFGLALGVTGTSDDQSTLLNVEQQQRQQGQSSGQLADHQNAQPGLFPHNYAQVAMNGGGAHPFMFHMTSAGATDSHLVSTLSPIGNGSHILDPAPVVDASAWPPAAPQALLSPNSAVLTGTSAHPSPFRPGGLLDPTTNTASGSTFLFDVSLMNPSPMASPYMVRNIRPGSSSASLSSDSRPASAHSGLVIHSSHQHNVSVTPPQPLASGSGAAETAQRAVAGTHYQRTMSLDTYELARALGGPIHPSSTGSESEAAGRSGLFMTTTHSVQQCNGSYVTSMGDSGNSMLAADPHERGMFLQTSAALSGAALTLISCGNGSGTLASALGSVGNSGNGGGSLSPLSVSSVAGNHGGTSLGDLAGSQQRTPYASTSPTAPSSLFFPDASSPGTAMAGGGVGDGAASSADFGSEFGLVVGDHLDPLISAAHGDEVNGFEQLVQALLMNHPDMLPSNHMASAGAGVAGSQPPPTAAVGCQFGMSSMDVFGSKTMDAGSTDGLHRLAEMHVDLGEGSMQVDDHQAQVSEAASAVSVSETAGEVSPNRPQVEMSRQSEEPMDVDMEGCERLPQAAQAGDEAAHEMVGSCRQPVPQADDAMVCDQPTVNRDSVLPPPTPTCRPHRQLGHPNIQPQEQQQQQQGGEPDPLRQRDTSHDEHTAAAALMLVELHNRTAPEHRRMSTIDVPPPSPPSIVRVQTADGGTLARSPSVLPLTLPGSALYAQQRSHLHHQRPANTLVPDTFTPTTRTLSDRQLQTVVESMLYAISLQGSCHSQGCWHMYSRAYFSTHGELPRDADMEPARWVGRWGLCKVTLYTPRVAQKSYGSEKRFLCPPPMISIVGSPLFPESPLGQFMGLPPAPANDKVPRWLTLLPETYQPQVIMLMRGEIEGAELPEDMSTDGNGGYGGFGEAMDVVVSTQRGERVMLSEAGWKAAANSMPPGALSKMIAALDRTRDKRVAMVKRQRQQQEKQRVAGGSRDVSTDVDMEDDHQEEDHGEQGRQSAEEDDEDEPVTASTPRHSSSARPGLRSSVRTRSQARLTPTRSPAAATVSSPRKAAAQTAPMVRTRRASIASKKMVVLDSSSSGESDQDASEDEDDAEDRAAVDDAGSAAGKTKGRAVRESTKGLVYVEKYCTEAPCAEVPGERWVFRNVWISDSERRKEFSCVFQLSGPEVTSAAASVPTSGGDKSKVSSASASADASNTDSQPLKQLLEFASKPVRVISKPSKKKIEVRSTGASPSAGIIYAGSIIALFNRIRSQTVSTKYLSIGSSVSIPSNALTRDVLAGAEVNKPQKWQGDVDLDQDRFLANADAVKHVFPGAIKSEQLKYLCSTASWTALRIEVVDEFERDSPYLNLPQFNCQCEVCATAAEYRDALMSVSPGVSGASTPELGGSSGGAGSGTSSSSTRFSKRQSSFTTQCLTRGKIVSFNQTVVLIDPVTGLRSREFILRRVNNNTTVILAEGHLPTSGAATAANASLPSQATKSGRATSSSQSTLSSDQSSGGHSSHQIGSSQFPPLRPYHTHPWVLHTYRQAGPCASHDPHSASATSHALSIIQVSGSRTGLPDSQTMTRAFEAPKLDPIAQLHKVAFQLKDSSEYTGAFLTVVGNDIGLYIPQSNHMSFIPTDEPKRGGGARARRNSCPAQPSQLSEVGSTQGVRTGTLTVEVTEGSVWTIVNADKVDRSFYVPHPHLLDLDAAVGVDDNHRQCGTVGGSGDTETKLGTEKILATASPSRNCVSSLSALSPFPKIVSHTITTASRSYMSDGRPNMSCVQGMSTTIVLDGDHFLDHPFNIYLADMKCVVDWESNTRATVTLPSPVTILRHLFPSPATAQHVHQSQAIPSDASLSPKYSAFIVTPNVLHGKIVEERVDMLSSGSEAQLMSASQHPGGVVKAPIPVRLLSERIIGISLGSNPIAPPLRPSTPPMLATHSVSAMTPYSATATPMVSAASSAPNVPTFACTAGATDASVTNITSPLRTSSVSNDTHQVQPSSVQTIGPTHVMSAHPAAAVIPPPAGTAYPSALTTAVSPPSIFSGANQHFPPHIQQLLQRGTLAGIPSAFPNMPTAAFNPLDARFVTSAPPAALVDAFASSRYLRASLPIPPDAKYNTQPRPTVLPSHLSYVQCPSSAVVPTSNLPPPSHVNSSVSSLGAPGTPAPVRSLSGKTSASQRTPQAIAPAPQQNRTGKPSPDSSSLSSAASTPPLTAPIARSATLPHFSSSALKPSGAVTVTGAAPLASSASAGRRGQVNHNTSKRQAAPETPTVVPLPVGVVTVDMVTSPSLLLPLYFVRADGVVYETGRSFLFRLDETVLGSGSVVVLE